ncbi:MAG: AAA family ATPase, partial [Treponema sp.]|nr:AAA family ATPase [Treponema sp.]
MAFAVAVGKSDFASLRQEGAYYIDKTELIYELVHDVKNEVTLFTRPRRFGKTLAMSMIDNFFNVRKDSRAIFEGLDIMRHTDFCKEWMNSRPVLFVSLKDVEGKNFEDAYKKLENKIFDQYNLFSSILKDMNLFDIDKRFFEELKSGASDIADFQTSLKNLMMILYSFYGKKVIVLIDDYDVPLTKAMEKNSSENLFYTRMQEVMRGFMNCSLKDNEFLDFAVLTGKLPVTDESIFGRNCVVPYTILDDRFSECFGFTESEVDAMLVAADRKAAAPAIKEWYDGYVFGTSHVYCPWDVINYLSALSFNRAARPKAFWKDSSHNGVLRTFVGRTDFNIKGKFEALMNGGTVTQAITDMLTYDTLHAT